MKPRFAPLALLVSTATLSGCASVAIGTDAIHRQQAAEMEPLIGQPVSAAEKRYGPPASERDVLGQRVETWVIDNWTTGGQCVVRLTLNDSDTIVAWAVEGRACAPAILKEGYAR